MWKREEYKAGENKLTTKFEDEVIIVQIRRNRQLKMRHLPLNFFYVYDISPKKEQRK